MSSTPVLNDGSSLNPNKMLHPISHEPLQRPSPLPTHLSVTSTSSGHSSPRVLPAEGLGGSGYVAPTFEGKEKQMESVIESVLEKAFIPEDVVQGEVEWFYDQLGIDDMYFATESVEA